MFGSLGMPELLVIGVIVLIIFGAGKLPEIGTGIGETIKNFKESIKTPPEEITSSKKDDTKKIENKS